MKVTNYWRLNDDGIQWGGDEVGSIGKNTKKPTGCGKAVCIPLNDKPSEFTINNMTTALKVGPQQGYTDI